LSDGVAELIKAGQPSSRDPFAFDVRVKYTLTGKAHGQTLMVTARLGQSPYQQFPIDMTLGLTLIGPVEVAHQRLPVQIDDVADPPPMRPYPLADQAADKVAAMYETHREGQPSSRYRDLVDLVIITSNYTLDQDILATALRTQATIRGLTLPNALISPSPNWEGGYAREAANAKFETHHRKLAWALEHVGSRIDSALKQAAPTTQPDDLDAK